MPLAQTHSQPIPVKKSSTIQRLTRSQPATAVTGSGDDGELSDDIEDDEQIRTQPAALRNNDEIQSEDEDPVEDGTVPPADDIDEAFSHSEDEASPPREDEADKGTGNHSSPPQYWVGTSLYCRLKVTDRPDCAGAGVEKSTAQGALVSLTIRS